MNIYEKLQAMRSELQGMNIKKSGVNKFAGFKYYELADILPPINDLQVKYKTCSITNFTTSVASLTIFDSEKTEDKITIELPMCEVTIRGANNLQNLGGAQTYLRRYLYMSLFEIVENDYFDAIQGSDKAQPKAITSNCKREKQSLQSNDNVKISEGTLKTIKSKAHFYATISEQEEDFILNGLASVFNKPLEELSEYQGEKLLNKLNNKIQEYSIEK